MDSPYASYRCDVLHSRRKGDAGLTIGSSAPSFVGMWCANGKGDSSYGLCDTLTTLMNIDA